MDTFSHVPPGFRFHPTDEELVDYYLKKKVASKRIDLDVIKDVDLYRIEPWDLEELCKLGTEDQNDWYFFSHKDKKYPTGTRTNRATKQGFWKATGRDKAIYSKQSLVGMRKTLVFYKGRAPNGMKSDWIMHEYRLETDENGPPQEEGWVVCRVFKKRLTTVRKMDEHEPMCNWYDDQVSFMPDFESPRQISHEPYTAFRNHQYSCKQELDQLQYFRPHERYFQLPQLESPRVPHSAAGLSSGSVVPYGFEHFSTLTQEEQMQHSNQTQNLRSLYGSSSSNNIIHEHAVDQVTDWQVLDKFVASQLGQDNQDATTSKETTCSNDQVLEHINMLCNDMKRTDDHAASESNSLSAMSCQMDLWK